MAIYRLSKNNFAFPPVHLADQDGLLAIGGDLNPQRLLQAYSEGIFPWFGADEPYLWWSPDPRFVLFTDELKVSKSMRNYFNGQKFQVTFDRAFRKVVESCRDSFRKGQDGTWITSEMLDAYHALHLLGYAHSVEVWQDENLVGGLYGISLGLIFFGESMFARVSNASKYGFITLVRILRERGFVLVDCQQETPHLASLGARPVSRKIFIDMLQHNSSHATNVGNWGSWLDQ